MRSAEATFAPSGAKDLTARSGTLTGAENILDSLPGAHGAGTDSRLMTVVRKVAGERQVGRYGLVCKGAAVQLHQLQSALGTGCPRG